MTETTNEAFRPRVSRTTRFAGALYRRLVRRFLPEAGPVAYSGIPVALTKKIGDDFVPRSLLPFMHHDIADYEATLIAALREALRPGDQVVVVGGGIGVTAAVAKRLVGPGGKVSCFEGSARQIELMQATFARNGLAGAIEVRNAIIGQNIGVYGGGRPEVTILPPTELPACDVLELDCEGAEIPILEQMLIRPATIIVETHGLHGASTAKVRLLLEELGYQVEDRGWAEPSRVADCVAGDIRILLARVTQS